MQWQVITSTTIFTSLSFSLLFIHSYLECSFLPEITLFHLLLVCSFFHLLLFSLSFHLLLFSSSFHLLLLFCFFHLPFLTAAARKHTGYKPFSCDLCGRAFQRKVNRDFLFLISSFFHKKSFFRSTWGGTRRPSTRKFDLSISFQVDRKVIKMVIGEDWWQKIKRM